MTVILLLLTLAAAPFAGVPLADEELAAHRGGFRLPGGVDVAMTIDTQTAVDGAVVLRTVFRADQGTPTLTTWVPRAGETVAAAPAGAAAPVRTAPTISYDRQNGIQVTGGVSAGSAPAGLVLATRPGAIPAGLEQASGGAATAAGQVSERTQGALRLVELTGGDLSVTHIAGGAFGAAIANMGNDRVIETQTSVAIDLSHTGPDVIGSAMLRAQDITAQALAGRL
ncbi:hypothetical protein [Sphingomonas adhaesiva]|uniref:hypothetical protein n=1 Tax=Sphingomonas adhaesiva TaxID=28212 RepID=UPI002FF9AEC1